MNDRHWSQSPFWLFSDGYVNELGEQAKSGPPRSLKNLTLLTVALLPFASYAFLPDKKAKVDEQPVKAEAPAQRTKAPPVLPGPPATELPLLLESPPAPLPPPAPTPDPGLTPAPSPTVTPSPEPAPPPPTAGQPPAAAPSSPVPPPPPPPGTGGCDAIADPAGFEACIMR